MVLRNVPSTATFEEQRVEINELATDVDTLASSVLTAESDTLQTVTGRGFTTTNPIKIENNAATAFVVEDGSSNEKFVVDSVNGKINVGSSAGGASGIYLFHNNAGATPAITLDGATGTVTGDLTGNVTGDLTGDVTGNADTATALETARNIGGVSFDGTANINLPGVNTGGNQDTSGNAATATALQTARNIGGVSFNGSADINLPGVNAAGNQDTSGTAALAQGLTGSPNITVTDITGGAASFSDTLTIGSGSAAPNDYGLIAYADADTLSNKSAVYARNLSDGRNFTGDNAAGATTFELYASGLGNFGSASNSTGNNGIAVGGNNGSLNVYTDRYTTDCFQILNTSGSGTNIALQAFGNGKLNVAAGNLRIEDVGDGTNSVKITTDPGSGGSGSKLIFNLDSSQDAVTIYNAGLKVGSGGTDKINLNGSDGSIAADGTISDSKGDLRKIPFKQEGSAYTLVAADAGKAIEAQGNITVPNGVFGSGDAITIINDTASDLSISMGSGLGNMFNVATGTSGNLTFGGRGMATIYFVNNTTCYISGSQLS